MTNNIGPLIGAGLTILAAGVVVKGAKVLTDTMASQAKNVPKKDRDLYRKIWG